jgi:NAD(P)-dependent dehydrogenase (short-subunit alcohol dehydrogenase family)
MITRILITGSNSGLGYLTAKKLASYSNCEVLLGCRTISKADEAAQSIQASSQIDQLHLTPVQAPLDLSKLSTVKSFAKHVEKHHGSVDVLVNCAGVFLSEKAHNTKFINAIAPTLLTELIRPTTRTISIITSPEGQSKINYPEVSDFKNFSVNPIHQYVHSKQLFSCMLTHLASEGIGGNHVLLGPGSVDTGIHSNTHPDIPLWIKVMMKLNTFFYHGTPESASESMVQASLGKFDGGATDDDSTGDMSKNVNQVTVVDLGKKIDMILCNRPERNRDLYNAMMSIVKEN